MMRSASTFTVTLPYGRRAVISTDLAIPAFVFTGLLSSDASNAYVSTLMSVHFIRSPGRRRRGS